MRLKKTATTILCASVVRERGEKEREREREFLLCRILLLLEKGITPENLWRFFSAFCLFSVEVL